MKSLGLYINCARGDKVCFLDSVSNRGAYARTIRPIKFQSDVQILNTGIQVPLTVAFVPRAFRKWRERKALAPAGIFCNFIGLLAHAVNLF